MVTGTRELRAIRREDIPEKYQDLVELLGLDMFLSLVRLCGGMSLYIPMSESLMRGGRDREIRARYDGTNARYLAREFHMTERHVYKIVSGTRL